MTPLVIDNFAGGGGASHGIEQAIGRPVDFAINHDPEAMAMHRANHPDTVHVCQDVWSVNPVELTRGHTVALAWFSPDCTHHSKAKGGKPRKKEIRDLAWVVIKWARVVRPRVIMLENVEEFRDWGPLLENGKPCPKRRGFTFLRWVGELKRQGYRVEYRQLRACDYGAPTIRTRLFLIARCDGLPIVWPEPTHGDPDHGRDGLFPSKLKPWRTAAQIIDWSIPCPSIFASSEEIMAECGIRAVRPLAPATLKRIAKGVMRYVVEAKQPFFVSYAQQSGANRSAEQPLHTVTASKKDQNCVVCPTLIQTGYGERAGQQPRVPGLEKPLGTAVAGGCKHALVAAFLAQHNTGVLGRDCRDPVSTVMQTGSHQAVVSAHIHAMAQNGASFDPREPFQTVLAGAARYGVVASFLAPYYGSGSGETGRDLRQPTPTSTTRDRLQLVTVEIDGQTYAIADIGMRMLTPRELFRAQGFPDRYIIDPKHNGKPLTKTAQIRMCGNSVCPGVAAALVRANVDATELREVAQR